jgi:hypothetical protein
MGRLCEERVKHAKFQILILSSNLLTWVGALVPIYCSIFKSFFMEISCYVMLWVRIRKDSKIWPDPISMLGSGYIQR